MFNVPFKCMEEYNVALRVGGMFSSFSELLKLKWDSSIKRMAGNPDYPILHKLITEVNFSI